MFQVVHAPDEALVFCTVSIWHGARENIVFGVGGDKAVGKNKNGAFTDDEAFKKAFTDAVTNALKLIGVGADVHMGLFDDSKYVASLRETREQAHQNAPDGYLDDRETIPDEHFITRDDGIQVLTMDAQRPIFSELERELLDCKSVDECKRWVVSAKSRASRLSGHWKDDLNRRYLTYIRSLEKQDADEYIEMKTG